MATKGTPFGGRDEIAERAYVNGADFSLVCYTNTPNSLTDSAVVATLVQPVVANGYAPIVLNGTWSVVNGILTYVHSTPTFPTWTATGTWSATVNGVAMIYGSRVIHFKDLVTPFVAANGRKLQIDMNTVFA